MSVSISRQWNTDENYWILHPIVKTIKIFGDLYNSDKSKNKDKSSRLMWAIALHSDPHEMNPWKQINISEKRELIAEDFLNDKKFDWKDEFIISLIDTYENHCLTVLEKEYSRMLIKLQQRGQFIHETDYKLDEYEEDEKGRSKITKGTAEQLDKMFVGTTKIYEQLKIIEGMISEESQRNVQGGAKESAGESKLI